MTEHQAHGAINRVSRKSRAEWASRSRMPASPVSRSQIRFCVKRHSSDGPRDGERGGGGGGGDIGCR